jgi:hypothetical protein
LFEGLSARVSMNKPLLDITARAPGVALPRLHRGRELWAGVHIALTKSEIERILRHRYQIYYKNRGANYHGLDHGTCTLRDPEDDSSILLYARDEAASVTASMRITIQPLLAVADPEQSTFIRRCPRRTGQNYAAQLARMCTSDSRRANPQLLRMMLFAYFFGINNGVQIAFLHSRNYHQSLYEHLGYMAIGEDKDGLVPMAINLRDWQGLQDARSPYQPILSLRETSAPEGKG